MRILDTDVCVELLRGNKRLLERRRSETDAVVTSWITACELYYGAERSARREANRVAVSDLLRATTILPLNHLAARWFGTLRARLEHEGRRIEDADLLIAALALSHGAVLVTGNTGHLRRIGELSTEDWIRGDP